MREHGWILAIYTRSDRRFVCKKCYNPDTRDAPVNCDECFGTGYKTDLEPWWVRYTTTLRRMPKPELQVTSAGDMDERFIYVIPEEDKIPVVQDLFFRVEWNIPPKDVEARGGRPVRVIDAVRVHDIDLEEFGGTISHIADCLFETESLNAFAKAILNRPLKYD